MFKMANVFTLENIDDFSEKINMDDLYEKKRQYDLNKLALFNKILNRVHVRIKTTSRQKIDEQFCWFVVPEIILGVPKYDQGACIAYLMDKLKTNGFNVKYIHPNTLFISWLHWVPSYVRSELKKKTGIEINEYGEKILDSEEEGKRLSYEPKNPDDYILNLKEFDEASQPADPKKKNYTPIKSYKPSGNLIYDEDLLNHMEDKFLPFGKR
jgi:hypothetical protein